MSGVIYGIRTIHNNKVYIGSTINFSKRVCAHLRTLAQNNHHNIWLQRVYNKYGADNLEFFILEQNFIEYLLSASIHRWCNNPDKVIIKQAVTRFRYLNRLEKNPIGLTYRDIGFWFEPKQP